MLLSVQVQTLCYYLLMGWLFALGFSLVGFIFERRFLYRLKGIMEVLYGIGFTLLLYRGLFYLNGGYCNIYLLGLFLCGAWLFYHWYYPVVLPFYEWIYHLFLPLRRLLVLVKRKIFGIMKVHKRKREKRKQDEKRKREEKKKQKEKQ